jgi:hypothetical protein
MQCLIRNLDLNFFGKSVLKLHNDVPTCCESAWDNRPLCLIPNFLRRHWENNKIDCCSTCSIWQPIIFCLSDGTFNGTSGPGRRFADNSNYVRSAPSTDLAGIVITTAKHRNPFCLSDATCCVLPLSAHFNGCQCCMKPWQAGNLAVSGATRYELSNHRYTIDTI